MAGTESQDELYRRAAREYGAPLERLAYAYEADADRRKSLERLLALVQRLEPSDRQLMLAYLEDMDAESIAEITGLSVANVWTKIHRIKSLLSRQFHKGGHDA
jgi:DNA-directed RNA polymerase specialized sigma24 family protein